MKKYAVAEINLSNLAGNLKLIKERVRNKKILIPVKCNAYGFGIIEISKFLEREGIDYLGVAYPFEAELIRRNRIKLPVLIFGPVINYNEFETIVHLNITPTIFSIEELKLLNKIACKQRRKVRIHINVDTGMGRLGFSYSDLPEILKYIKRLKNIIIEGIYTHFAGADDKEKKFTLNQIKKFNRVLKILNELKIFPKLIHASNSAGIINFPELPYNMVRPGIMFYGFYPDNKIRRNLKLKQGMTFKAYVTFIKEVPEGTPVSYGHTYYTRTKEKIATVSAGYGDGVVRLLSNKGYVLVNDKYLPITGRVCMDQFMINATDVDLKIGDEVIIFGESKAKELRLEKLAKIAKTIPYEILCNIGERVERIYINY